MVLNNYHTLIIFLSLHACHNHMYTLFVTVHKSPQPHACACLGKKFYDFHEGLPRTDDFHHHCNIVFFNYTSHCQQYNHVYTHEVIKIIIIITNIHNSHL